jgi:hypothetical protein
MMEKWNDGKMERWKDGRPETEDRRKMEWVRSGNLLGFCRLYNKYVNEEGSNPCVVKKTRIAIG